MHFPLNKRLSGAALLPPASAAHPSDASLNEWSATESPFHAGEKAMQQRTNVEKIADSQGRRGIRRWMPDQHQRFFEDRPLMIFGGLDDSGQPWASVRSGTPGFVSAPDAHHLQIEGGALPGDPLASAWKVGAFIGGLGIEPDTRRRNRVNGRIVATDGDTSLLEVLQSFGNCAKYIQRRTPELRAVPAPTNALTVRRERLDESDRKLIARADTFFVASANTSPHAGAARGADVSHRGGLPGFVRIDSDSLLTTPDYAGNRFFNTLGNLIDEPRAGLLFVDFDTGDLLYLATIADIVLDGPELTDFALAERLVRFRITEVRRTNHALPIRWSPPGYARELPTTIGQSTPTPLPERTSLWRAFTIAAVIEETPAIRSFHLEAADGAPLLPFAAGQYLPIRIVLEGQTVPTVRTYTLSATGNVDRYRISVKRDGAVSSALHTEFKAGMQIEALPPAGKFTFDTDSPRPAVFLSAGIGITPMVAMVGDAQRDGVHRALYFFHSAHQESARPFSAYLCALAESHRALQLHFFDSVVDETSSATPLVCRHTGRLDLTALKRVLPFDDYDFYLCGPTAFMRDLYEGLRAMNIADDRIRFETFGPASIRRVATPELPMPGSPLLAVASDAVHPVPVHFVRSGRHVHWTPQQGSLLDLAEASGISPASSCRSGMCGTCATRVLSGEVDYAGATEATIEPGHALICVAHPKRQALPSSSQHSAGVVPELSLDL